METLKGDVVTLLNIFFFENLTICRTKLPLSANSDRRSVLRDEEKREAVIENFEKVVF